MKKVAVAFSGGMDSTVMLHMAADQYDQVYALIFDYGQRHSIELECASKQLCDLRQKHPDKKIESKVIDVRFLREIAPTSSLTNDDIDTPSVKDMRGEAQPLSYVPNRNMMFLSILASYAEANDVDTIWYGAALVDSLAGYWDGSAEFLPAINNLLALNREKTVKVEAPLIEMSKEQIILNGICHEVDFAKTWTCYSAGPLADADSASSSMRLQGFINCGHRDPLAYHQQDKLNAIYDHKGCTHIEY
tara:strand:+ start:61 stop:801 length:741 start_codon:yes stop_codon:yes gene_type:complete